MEHKSEPVPGLIATVRSGIRLRDGYYLNEELVDLYLVGVLRGAAIGLMDAEGPYGQDADRRELRLRELTEMSIELLDHLNRLRPEPVRTNLAPLPRPATAGSRPESVSDSLLPDAVPLPALHIPAQAGGDHDRHHGYGTTGAADHQAGSSVGLVAPYPGVGPH